MTLKFPTQAEQAVDEFQNSPKTISLAAIAGHLAYAVEKVGSVRTYRFDDDSSLTVSGRGKSHKFETHLP